LFLPFLICTSACNNNKYFDFTKNKIYYRNLVDGKIIPLKIKEEDPEFYRTHERTLRVCFNRSRFNIPRVQPEVIWIHGDSGYAKTEYAHNYLKDYESLTLKNGYYGGLEGKQYLLYDNINPTIQNHPTLLKMLGNYKVHLHTKGCKFNFLYEKICICSYLNPLEYVKLHPGEQSHALFRRIDRIIHCTHDQTTNIFNAKEMKEENF
jgi:hypothetical protein